MNEQEKRNHVRALNLLRRHLSKDQLKEQMIAMRRDRMTLPAIAEAAGVSLGTAESATKGVLQNCKTVIGKDGKHYPAAKPRQPKTVVTTSQAPVLQYHNGFPGRMFASSVVLG